MKYQALSLSILFIFFAITIFGFVFMGHNMSGGSCVVSLLNGGACIDNRLEFAIAHVAAYAVFSNVIVSSLVFAIFYSIILAAAGFLIARSLQLFFLYRLSTSKVVVGHREKVSAWLSLFENSPSY